jgi:hypothetical protein
LTTVAIEDDAVRPTAAPVVTPRSRPTPRTSPTRRRDRFSPGRSRPDGRGSRSPGRFAFGAAVAVHTSAMTRSLPLPNVLLQSRRAASPRRPPAAPTPGRVSARNGPRDHRLPSQPPTPQRVLTCSNRFITLSYHWPWVVRVRTIPPPAEERTDRPQNVRTATTPTTAPAPAPATSRPGSPSEQPITDHYGSLRLITGRSGPKGKRTTPSAPIRPHPPPGTSPPPGMFRRPVRLDTTRGIHSSCRRHRPPAQAVGAGRPRP